MGPPTPPSLPEGGTSAARQLIVSAIAATAVAVRISRSVAERPGSSIQTRNDEASALLHDQIGAASPAIRGVVHPWHAGRVRAWGRACSKEMGLCPGLTGEARVSLIDEHRRTVVGEGRDYVGTGALGAAIDDVPLAVRELSAEI